MRSARLAKIAEEVSSAGGPDAVVPTCKGVECYGTSSCVSVITAGRASNACAETGQGMKARRA